MSAARGSNPQRTVRDKALAKARHAAYRALVQAHPDEFDRLYRDECAKAGVTTARTYDRSTR